MKLIVGLGNPGDKYRGHRHNVGFWVVDQLAKDHGAGTWQKQHEGLAAVCWIDSIKALLFKPQSYMNASGLPVRRMVDFYKIGLPDMLVIADDFALPLGRLRLRSRGSAGGQNGLKDILRHLGTDEVARLRVGIGSPGRQDPADYVLSDFSAAEKKEIDGAVLEAERATEHWCRWGIDSAMNEFNRKEKES